MRISLILVVAAALIAAGCSSGNQSEICTWEGGSLTLAERKIFGEGLPKQVQLQEALYRKLLPIHARKNDYDFSAKQREQEIQLFIENYYGDDATFGDDLKNQDKDRKSVEREVIYQALVDRFYEKYPIKQTVTNKESRTWYQDHTQLGQSGINRNAYVYTLKNKVDAQALYLALKQGTRPEGAIENVRAYDDEALLVKRITQSTLAPGGVLAPLSTPGGWIVAVAVGSTKSSYRVIFTDAEKEILQDIIRTRQQTVLHKQLRTITPKLDCGKEQPFG